MIEENCLICSYRVELGSAGTSSLKVILTLVHDTPGNLEYLNICSWSNSDVSGALKARDQNNHDNFLASGGAFACDRQPSDLHRGRRFVCHATSAVKDASASTCRLAAQYSLRCEQYYRDRAVVSIYRAALAAPCNPCTLGSAAQGDRPLLSAADQPSDPRRPITTFTDLPHAARRQRPCHQPIQRPQPWSKHRPCLPNNDLPARVRSAAR